MICFPPQLKKLDLDKNRIKYFSPINFVFYVGGWYSVASRCFTFRKK